MKTRNLLRLSAGFAVGLLLHQTLIAQSWQTVDDFEYVLGGSSGDITTNPNGSIVYAVGSAGTDQQGVGAAAVVRSSADKGATWTILQHYAVDGWSDAHFHGVATTANADGSTRVFAGGHLYNGPTPAQVQVWVIRESAQGDQTWETTDVFEGVNGWSNCVDIKVRPNGDVYASGLVRDTVNNTGYWLVRKRAAGAAAFQTVDFFNGGSTIAQAIAFHPSAGIFVVGTVGNFWTVRNSQDGVTWRTVDSVRGEGVSKANGIYVDNATGAIYVGGSSQQSLKKPNRLVNNWVVRRSTDGGATWTAVERYGAFTQSGVSATAITMSGGNIFVSGHTPDAWVVRKGVPNSNGVITWTTSDQYQLAPGELARANGITSDLEGNVFSTGRGTDAAGTYRYGLVSRWITRKLNE